MSQFYTNTVESVKRAPLLLMLVTEEQAGWCKQYSEEGYNVLRINYPSITGSFTQDAEAAKKLLPVASGHWALITYGIQNPHDIPTFLNIFGRDYLKAIIHYCPTTDDVQSLLARESSSSGIHIPTVFHLASSQESLASSVITLTDLETVGYSIPTTSYPPVTVYTYPQVSAQPPFPFGMKAPALVTAGEKSFTDLYTRSAVSLAYTRSLELLRRHLGPHFELEKLWEKHTYYEFVERDSQKTMSTMVATPYVNHVATLTGGVGYEGLARFYEYHFTGENVTPPDTELVTISRTVGADRIIDEMIFKCTHTTEIDYFLPGVKPTGKPLEIALVGVVAFRGDKLTFEHIYWDQASVLVQLGLLNPKGLPVAGVEVARKVIDPFGMESNKLMAKWKESEGLPL